MKALFLMFLALVAAICQAQIGQAGVKWRGYRSGTFSNVQSESSFVLNNEAEWQTYWKNQLGEKPENAPKDVKWGQELLLAVHLGRKNTGGFSVFVKSVDRPTANTIRVTFVERAPAPGSITAQVLSSPYEIIRLDRTGGNFEFKKETSTGPGVVSRFEWSVYQSESQCNITGARTLVITDQASFSRYWRELNGEFRAPTDVDWEKEMLVAIHLGRCPSNGYDVIVTGVDPILGSDLMVSYIDRRPARHQRVKVGSTSPYSIIRVPRFGGSVKFDRRVWDNGG